MSGLNEGNSNDSNAVVATPNRNQNIQGTEKNKAVEEGEDLVASAVSEITEANPKALADYLRVLISSHQSSTNNESDNKSRDEIISGVGKMLIEDGMVTVHGNKLTKALEKVWALIHQPAKHDSFPRDGSDRRRNNKGNSDAAAPVHRPNGDGGRDRPRNKSGWRTPPHPHSAPSSYHDKQRQSQQHTRRPNNGNITSAQPPRNRRHNNPGPPPLSQPLLPPPPPMQHPYPPNQNAPHLPPPPPPPPPPQFRSRKRHPPGPPPGSNRPHPPQINAIKLTNLPPNVTKQHLYNFFTQHKSVHIKFMVFQPPTAIIQFGNLDQAMFILHSPEPVLGNRFIGTELHHSNLVPLENSSNNNSAGPSNNNKNAMHTNNMPPVPPPPPPLALPKTKGTPTNTLPPPTLPAKSDSNIHTPSKSPQPSPQTNGNGATATPPPPAAEPDPQLLLLQKQEQVLSKQLSLQKTLLDKISAQKKPPLLKQILDTQTQICQNKKKQLNIISSTPPPPQPAPQPETITEKKPMDRSTSSSPTPQQQQQQREAPEKINKESGTTQITDVVENENIVDHNHNFEEDDGEEERWR